MGPLSTLWPVKKPLTAAITIPSCPPGIERSLVPNAMVVTASTTCERPKNRMNDNISGSRSIERGPLYEEREDGVDRLDRVVDLLQDFSRTPQKRKKALHEIKPNK